MATSAAAVAAAVARARREVFAYFEEHRAFDSQHAVAFDPPRHLQEKQLERLIGRGVVKPTMEGLFWLDREAYRLEEQRRVAAAKRMLLVIAGVFGLALAIASIGAFWRVDW
jgi:hypothetical protein